MSIYDSDTADIISTENGFLIPAVTPCDDIVFKASYIVASDLISSGKITALFDLVVYGDVKAQELDVKGRFVCFGRCEVEGAITVQYDIWASEIKADSVVCRDRITSQEISVNTILAEDKIVVAKTLSVEEIAATPRNIICGETVFGAGKITANMLVMSEDIDLDDGENGLSAPKRYLPKTNESEDTQLCSQFFEENDYHSYIDFLIKSTDNYEKQIKLKKWLEVLTDTEMGLRNDFNDCDNIFNLIILTEIIQSEYFEQWDAIIDWHTKLSNHFKDVILGKKELIGSKNKQVKKPHEYIVGDIVLHKSPSLGKGVITKIQDNKITVKFDQKDDESQFIVSSVSEYFTYLGNSKDESSAINEIKVKLVINNYEEWLHTLYVIEKHKDCFYDEVHDYLFEQSVSFIGLKSKFILDRMADKGWN